MIIRQRKETPYGRFFLVTEAPEDEPKRNIKVVRVKPDNRKRKDFTDYPDDEDTEEAEDNTEEGETEDEGPAVDEEDYAEDENPDSTEEDESNTNANDDLTDETNQDIEEAESDEENNDSDTPNDDSEDNTEEGETEDEGPAVDEEDYAEDENPDSTEEEQDEGSSGETTDNTETENPGTDYDSTRKYKLYGRFISLHTAADNYISKLENNIYDDLETNKVIKKATDSLREIRDLLYDYMLIKFQASTYTQSMLFYSNMIASIQLVFKLIGSVLKDETKK